MGRRYLEDILETMGMYVDSLKFAGGSFTLMTRSAVKEIINVCHHYDVLVSTGGFVESVVGQDGAAVENYIRECKDLGFDIIEVSCGFITIPVEDWLRLVDKVAKAGLKPKPEIGIQFGAGGATPVGELEAEATRDPAWAIHQMKRLLEAGAELIMGRIRGHHRKRQGLAQ
jgi:phosphosulfolactate synthase (CoM biosynthesis protein A)